MPGELDDPRNRADLARRLAAQATDITIAKQLEELAVLFLAEAAERDAEEANRSAFEHSGQLKLKPA